jgi:hypothetical protein
MDSHQTKLKQLRNDALLEPGLFVHFANQGPDAFFRKTPARLAKQLLVFG